MTSQGDRREPIDEDDEDRRLFLATLGEVVGQMNWVCHAYCLMSNHYHLVIETPDGNLAKGMRQLNGVYTQRPQTDGTSGWAISFRGATRLS